MITFEERVHPTTFLQILSFYSEDENWFIEVRETNTTNLSFPIVWSWMLVYQEGVVCEGSIGDLEEAKRHAEIAYNAFKVAL